MAQCSSSRSLRTTAESSTVPTRAPPEFTSSTACQRGGPASASARLDDPPTAGGSAYDFQISSDSLRVLYRADQDTQGVIELYEVDLGYAAYLPLLTQASGLLNR